jgi:tetratricopeptide (TPR) repeat protein
MMCPLLERLSARKFEPWQVLMQPASSAAYQKALAINPDHRGANEYLGELYLKTGDLEKARERLSKLQNLCPGGCEEYDDLKKAVGAYQAARK